MNDGIEPVAPETGPGITTVMDAASEEPTKAPAAEPPVESTEVPPEQPAPEKSTEQIIQEKGLTAPRVTPERIKEVIADAQFLRPTSTLTICILTLLNGYTVTGESACASPENFDEEIGNKIARKMAEEKVWALEGYLLKQKLFDAAYPAKPT